MLSEIQTMRKPIIQLQPSSQGSFLLLLDSTCLNDSILIKIEEPFDLSFYFKKPFFIFVTMMIVYKFGDLNFTTYPIQKALFSF